MDALLELHRQSVLAHPSCQPFWDAARDARLLLPQCLECEAYHWYPRSFCPFCHGDQVRWRTALGTGRIHACTSLQRDPSRTVVAYVELDEGPLMLTNIVGEALSGLKIDDPVEVAFVALETGFQLPVFRLRGVPPGTGS
jgi:uncharacterized OB-fold protein